MTHLVIYLLNSGFLLLCVFHLLAFAADVWASSDFVAVPVYWEGEAAEKIIAGDVCLVGFQFHDTSGHSMPGPGGVH